MSAKGFSEAERQVVTALLETKAVNFDALGGVVAKHGATATLHFDGEDIFCGTMRRFIRIFRLRDELAGLTWPYLAEKWSAAAVFAFHVLARVEDEAGFLPAPLTRLDRYYSLSGEERSRYAMATAYHTAYVMGLLCAAALRPAKAPPARIPLTRRKVGIEILLEFIDSDGRRPHWRDDLSKLQAREQEALAPMLLTIALRRAVERRDLNLVRTLLEYGLRYGLVNSPPCRQAAALLRRLAAAET